MQHEVITGMQRILGIRLNDQALIAMLELAEQGCHPNCLMQIMKDARQIADKS